MKAVILVGGEGTRLRPLTCHTPKSMVPILNTPFLEHVTRHLKSHNINEIVLALSHLSQPITDYFHDGSQFNVKMDYTVEKVPLGTAGAARMAYGKVDGAFAVLNGDIFTDLDISRMLAFHKANKAKVTIALTPVEDPTAYGLIETDGSGRVTRFLEKPTWDQVTTNNINAGTYILEPEVLDHIPADTKFSFEREVFPTLLKNGERVFAFPSDAYWIDIGTPEKYLKLQMDLLNGKVHNEKNIPSGLNQGKNTTINPTAKITGAVVIGDNCTIEDGARVTGPAVIGHNCRIGRDAVIDSSVIWWNVNIGAGAVVKNSIVANDCVLQTGCSLTGAVLGKNNRIAANIALKSNCKVWPDNIVTTPEPPPPPT